MEIELIDLFEIRVNGRPDISTSASLTSDGPAVYLFKRRLLRQIPYGNQTQTVSTLSAFCFCFGRKMKDQLQAKFFPGFPLYLTKVENLGVQLKSHGAFLRFSSLHIFEMCPRSTNADFLT